MADGAPFFHMLILCRMIINLGQNMEIIRRRSYSLIQGIIFLIYHPLLLLSAVVIRHQRAPYLTEFSIGHSKRSILQSFMIDGRSQIAGSLFVLNLHLHNRRRKSCKIFTHHSKFLHILGQCFQTIGSKEIGCK